MEARVEPTAIPAGERSAPRASAREKPVAMESAGGSRSRRPVAIRPRLSAAQLALAVRQSSALIAPSTPLQASAGEASSATERPVAIRPSAVSQPSRPIAIRPKILESKSTIQPTVPLKVPIPKLPRKDRQTATRKRARVQTQVKQTREKAQETLRSPAFSEPIQESPETDVTQDNILIPPSIAIQVESPAQTPISTQSQPDVLQMLPQKSMATQSKTWISTQSSLAMQSGIITRTETPTQPPVSRKQFPEISTLPQSKELAPSDPGSSMVEETAPQPEAPTRPQTTLQQPPEKRITRSMKRASGPIKPPSPHEPAQTLSPLPPARTCAKQPKPPKTPLQKPQQAPEAVQPNKSNTKQPKIPIPKRKIAGQQMKPTAVQQKRLAPKIAIQPKLPATTQPQWPIAIQQFFPTYQTSSAVSNRPIAIRPRIIAPPQMPIAIRPMTSATTFPARSPT